LILNDINEEGRLKGRPSSFLKAWPYGLPVTIRRWLNDPVVPINRTKYTPVFKPLISKVVRSLVMAS
jgi:hypothetical protein